MRANPGSRRQTWIDLIPVPPRTSIMYYIRLLRAPRIQESKITAVVTITSDLGDAFFPRDVDIIARLHQGTVTVASKRFPWKKGMRVIKIDLLACNQALLLEVTSTCAADDLVKAQGSILTAWSIVGESDYVARRLQGPWGTIQIWEETGESIARHIWYVNLPRMGIS